MLLLSPLLNHRKNLNLTRENFSKKINISPQFLAEIENGKKGMYIETLYKIYTIFGISSDYLLFGNFIADNCNNSIYNILKDNPHFNEIQNILISLNKITKSS